MADFRWFELFNIYNHPLFLLSLVISLGIIINSIVRKDRGLDYT